MKKNSGIVSLVFFVIISLLLQGYNNTDKIKHQKLKDKECKIKAESLEELVKFIESDLLVNNSKKLEKIKKINDGLVKKNSYRTIEECSAILDTAIEKELSGDNQRMNILFQTAQTLAEMYYNATTSRYLFDKVSIFRRWGKDEKREYIKAMELLGQGEELYEYNKYDESLKRFDRSLKIFHKIGYKEGEANCIESMGHVHWTLAKYENALKLYKQSLALYRENMDRLGEASCLQGLGNVYNSLNEHETSRRILEQAMAIYRAFNDRLGEATCLESMGDGHLLLAEYENALNRYKQALVLFREFDVHLGEASCLKSMGDTHLRSDNYEKARKLYEQALVIFMQIKDRSNEANCLQSLGSVHIRLDEYAIAKERIEQALKIYKDTNLRLGEAICLKSLGDVHFRLGEYDIARRRLEQALVINREISCRVGEASCLRSLGDVHINLAEYENAWHRFEKALIIYREIKARLGEANCLKGMGDIQSILDKHENARHWYKQALGVYREINSRLGEANCLRNIGEMNKMLGENENSQQSYEQALVIYKMLNSPLGEANCMINIGDVQKLYGNFDNARQWYEKALVIYRKIKHRQGESGCLQSLGDVYMNLSKYEKARQLYEKGLEVQKKIGARSGMIWSFYGMGKTFEVVKNYREAAKNYQKSIQIIEDVWREMKSEEYKTLFFGSNVSPYSALISTLFKCEKEKEAYHFAERSKARTFLYLLGNKRIRPMKGVPIKLVKKEEELRQEITLLSIKIQEIQKQKVNQKTSSEKFRDECLQLKQKHSEVLKEIKLNSPEYASMLTVNPLSSGEIQVQIRDSGNAVLIEYYTTPDSIYFWLLDRKQIYPYKKDITDKALNKKIQVYHSMISNTTFGVDTLSSRAQELYDLLLKPVEIHLNGKSCIGVIPHGILHYLPFDALMNKGKFIVEHNIKIFYLPSASTYKYCREKNQLKKENAVAFVNPDGTLPSSEKEAEDLKRLFPQNIDIFSGEKATESSVKKDAGSTDILHFACHGDFDASYPMYSSLLLAPDKTNDGRLEVQEIFQLKLKPAYLVTLSACETNLGKISPGDEIVGLTRAFIYAGTPSLLASLWKVDDYYTRKLMVEFYTALKDLNKIDALHTARHKMIKDYGMRHPYYWAAFVLIGDYR